MTRRSRSMAGAPLTVTSLRVSLMDGIGYIKCSQGAGFGGRPRVVSRSCRPQAKAASGLVRTTALAISPAGGRNLFSHNTFDQAPMRLIEAVGVSAGDGESAAVVGAVAAQSSA